MTWYVSERLDSPEEFAERVKFYEDLLCKNLTVVRSEIPSCLEFNDGRRDNRCIIIGHTDTATNVIIALKKRSNKKYKVYLSVCEMKSDVFEKWRKITGYEIYTWQRCISTHISRITLPIS